MGSPGSEELGGSTPGGSAAPGSRGSCADGSGGWSSKRVIEFLLSLFWVATFAASRLPRQRLPAAGAIRDGRGWGSRATPLLFGYARKLWGALLHSATDDSAE